MSNADVFLILVLLLGGEFELFVQYIGVLFSISTLGNFRNFKRSESEEQLFELEINEQIVVLKSENRKLKRANAKQEKLIEVNIQVLKSGEPET